MPPLWGTLILRHLRCAIWVFIPEQGTLYPLCVVLNGEWLLQHFRPFGVLCFAIVAV